MVDIKSHYQSLLAQQSGGSVHQQAARRFGGEDIPARHMEEWKYTNLDPLISVMYQPVDGNVEHKAISPATNTFYFTDTRLTGSGSSNLQIIPLTQVLQSDPGFIGRFETGSSDFFSSLAEAITDGDFALIIPKGFRSADPLRLTFDSSGHADSQLIPIKLWIYGERGSEATLITDFRGDGLNTCLRSVSTRIHLEESSILKLVTLQREGSQTAHVNRQTVTVSSNSVFKSWALSLNGLLVRNHLRVNLNGEGAETELYGLSVTAGTNQVENHTFIDHRKPHGTSLENYKGILTGQSTVVFDGRIIVQEGAQKTFANQSNRNLLLSPEATADAKPQLEIYADDVKCYHGATVGQLDEDQLFYLKARGIDENLGKSILTQAFAMDVISSLPDELLKEELNNLIPDLIQPARSGGKP